VNIAFVDLKAQYAKYKTNIDARIQTVLTNCNFIMGSEIAELENKFCEYINVKNSVAVSSGTDALLAVLMAIDVKAGDAVFLPSFTFTATAEVVALLGAHPVFIDVKEDTFNIDPKDLENKIEQVKEAGNLNPKAVIPVDLFGLPAEYDIINELCKKYDLFCLADAAQSFGASVNGVKVGLLTDATATSFFPAKPLGCYGDGGAIFTSNDELTDTIKSIRLHGKGKEKYTIERIGLNARLDTLQAAVLLVKLEEYDWEFKQRNKIADIYRKELNSEIQLSIDVDGVQSAWAQFSIIVKNRDELQSKLKEKNIPTMIYYPKPMHKQACFDKYSLWGSLPVSEKLSGEILSLPIHPFLSEDEIKTVVSEVNNCYSEL